MTPAEAERKIRENLPVFSSEECPLADATGRVLHRDLRGDRDLPPFDRVTMDGYAVRAAALAAGQRTFRVEATQAAGMSNPCSMHDSDGYALKTSWTRISRSP